MAQSRHGVHICVCWVGVSPPAKLVLSSWVWSFQACQPKSSSLSVQRFNSETTPPHPNATVGWAGSQKTAESLRVLLGSQKQSWILMQALGHARKYCAGLHSL
ncbi:hypothetical protein AMECASPLE_016448 [Ameca splendens]|uniref:Secreted protein n=1 Tax=Ameca splendens TaxID=208324 RepID=A0ABV0ZLZ9_9TELE